MKEQAADLPGNASAAENKKLFLEQIAKKILQTGKQDGVDPLRLLQGIAKYDLRSDQILKTGEELPDVIKKLLGQEDNLKASVMQTTSHAITQSVNKKMLDRLAKVGQDEGWLFKSREAGIAKGILDVGDNPIGKLKDLVCYKVQCQNCLDLNKLHKHCVAHLEH